MHNRIGWLLDLRFGHVLHADVADGVKHNGFHEQLSPRRSMGDTTNHLIAIDVPVTRQYGSRLPGRSSRVREYFLVVSVRRRWPLWPGLLTGPPGVTEGLRGR